MSGMDAYAQRLRDRLAEETHRARATPSCSDADTIWVAAHGELERERLDELLDHAASCPRCAELWRLVAEVRAAERELASATDCEPSWEGPSGARSGRRPAAWVWIGTVAAVAAVLLLVVRILDPGNGPGGALDPGPATDSGGEITLRGGVDPPPAGASDLHSEEAPLIASLLAEDQLLSRARPILRWSAPAGAERYEIVVSTGELVRILARERGLIDAEYRIPDAVLEELPPGTKIVWRVQARLADGRRVASGAFVHRLK